MFVSTRANQIEDEKLSSFRDVVLQGLAPDGGLYVPVSQVSGVIMHCSDAEIS